MRCASVKKPNSKQNGLPGALGDHTTRFAAALDTLERSRKTIAAYQGELARFAAWYLDTAGEPAALEAITTTDLLEYKRTMIARDCKPATVNRAMAAVKTFLRWGRDDVPEIPKRIRQAPGELKWLDRREQLALMRVVERSGNKRDLAIVQILIETGLRVAELVGLEWRDVEIGDRKGRVVVRFGKGAKWRTVLLTAAARLAFRTLMQDHDPRGRVFQGQRGPIGTRGVQFVLDKYAEAARIANLTPHMLRHTFCKNLERRGVALSVIASLAGHSSILTTQRYITASASDRERAIELMDGDQVDR